MTHPCLVSGLLPIGIRTMDFRSCPTGSSVTARAALWNNISNQSSSPTPAATCLRDRQKVIREKTVRSGDEVGHGTLADLTR